MKGLLWLLVVGVPLLAICLLGLCAGSLGWQWLERRCDHWYRAIYEG